MHPSRPILLLLLALIVTASTVSAQRNRGDRYAHLGFKTGEAFPDILLPDVESGKLRSLKEFRGKKIVVLHFASW